MKSNKRVAIPSGLEKVEAKLLELIRMKVRQHGWQQLKPKDVISRLIKYNLGGTVSAADRLELSKKATRQVQPNENGVKE